jgi:hypothetical protein
MTQFSPSASDYIPAQVSHARTAFDPRSTIPVPSPTCEVGSNGTLHGGIDIEFVRDFNDVEEGVIAGGWDCSRTVTSPLDGKQQGTGFTVSLAAVNAKPTVPTMSAAALEPGAGGDAKPGSVRTRTVTIAKHEVAVYTWQWTENPDGGGQLYDSASAEPLPHLQLTTSTLATTKNAAPRALRNLLIMLRTGARVKGTERGITSTGNS